MIMYLLFTQKDKKVAGAKNMYKNRYNYYKCPNPFVHIVMSKWADPFFILFLELINTKIYKVQSPHIISEVRR